MGSQAKASIENRLKKIVDSDPTIYNAYLLIHSDQLKIHWNMAYGHDGDLPVEQPYHTASIGKTFTAVMIAMLVEQGKIRYEDFISKHLEDDLLNEIHIYKGKDYSRQITIEHLVSHQSGLADYYEGKSSDGKRFIEILLDEPSRAWNPEETIKWTKEHLQPKFPPGTKCFYSDTGYNLLGLIIERVTSKPYHQVLHETIFQPLQMNDSYLAHYSQPALTSNDSVAKIHLNKRQINVEDFLSSTSNYAGGQTVSTSEDLLKFMKALVSNQLISEESLNTMFKWNKLWMGIDYGYGLMKIRMIPFSEKYNVWGHLGSIGSFMLYNPKMDVYVIGNFNHDGYTSKSVRFVYRALRELALLESKRVGLTR